MTHLTTYNDTQSQTQRHTITDTVTHNSSTTTVHTTYINTFIQNDLHMMTRLSIAYKKFTEHMIYIITYAITHKNQKKTPTNKFNNTHENRHTQ